MKYVIQIRKKETGEKWREWSGMRETNKRNAVAVAKEAALSTMYNGYQFRVMRERVVRERVW